MLDLRTAAELLLQTAQIHQIDLEALNRRQQESDQRFEIWLAEMRQLRLEHVALEQRIDAAIEELREETRQLRENQRESDRRFEILLAELRQLRIDTNERFDRLFDRDNPQN